MVSLINPNIRQRPPDCLRLIARVPSAVGNAQQGITVAAIFDLVIRGGTVADGTGAPLFDADVAVAGNRIAQIGTGLPGGREEIDARGRLVTPGFVDIHTHYDGQAAWDSRLAPSSWHGVTTAVMGNCGVGFAPVRAADRGRLVELMEGVEDIPEAVLHEGLGWQWESFAQYLDYLAGRPHDIDFCAQLPHGALRVYVMGERGARLEAATDEDIARMRSLTADAMRAGAIGFSTSRTLNHRTVKGDPTPSLRATEAELTGIVLGMRDAGSGVIEMISDFRELDAEFSMARRLVQASGRPMTISLAQNHVRTERWRDLLALMEAACAQGLPIRGQVAPRPIGLLYGLQATLHPFCRHPSYRQIAELGLAERVSAMRSPQMRARLLAEQPEEAVQVLGRRLTDFERIFPLGEVPDYEPRRDQSVAAIAQREGRAPAEVAYDLLLEDEGRNFLSTQFANYADFDLEACRAMLASDCTLPGLGDGGAHVGIIADASFPTYLLTHWGRDRPTGRFDLAWLVSRQTRDTARAVGLTDRGTIAPGMKADLNVIDFGRLNVERPYMAFDLPAGGRRLLQRARGYEATIVSGEIVYREGEATGALPGALVRGQAH
jgi:N-acyl-D-aspartate/D-glutamate deacylase